MLISVTFITTNASNDGKIRLRMQANTVPVDEFNIYWGVTGPSGQELKALPADDNPDAQLGTGGLSNIFVDIPIGSDAEYQAGGYVFAWRWFDAGAPETVNEGTINFNYQPNVRLTSEELTIAAEYNCLTGKISVTDSNSIPGDGWVLDSRTWTVTPPTIAGESAPIPETADTASAEFDFGWNNAPYQINLVRFQTYTLDEGDYTVTVQEQLTANTVLNIACSTDMCDIAACLEAKYNSLNELACSSGGSWKNIPTKDFAALIKTMAELSMALAFKECGNYNKAAQYSSLATGCGCGCSDTAPAPVAPPTPYTPPV